MKRHLPVLDGVRGLAALMVMGFHYFQTPGRLPPGTWGGLLRRISPIGQTGVDLFFVLSGFLITRILLSTRSQESYFSNFYARRCLRILPLYYFFLVFFFFIQPVLTGQVRPAPSQGWWWWVFLQNIPMALGLPAQGPGHYWSLAVEEHFYLVWPLLVYLLPRRGLAAAALAFIAVALALRVPLARAGISSFYFTATRFDALSFGTLLAVWEPELAARPSFFNKLFWAGGLAVGLPLLAAFPFMSGAGAAWLQIVKYTLVGFCYFALLGLAVTAGPHSVLASVLGGSFLRWAGRISYGLYIYHGTCFEWLDRVFPRGSALVHLPLAFALSALVAFLSFRFLESPFLSLKANFRPAPATRLSNS